VTIIDKSPQLRTIPHDGDLGADPFADGVAVVETTELRWFAEEQLTSDVNNWFTCGGTTGTVEERCDTYRLDGPSDRGVKRRFRETLELKVRQSVGEQLVLAGGLAGRLELWRKWSPADGLVESDRDVPWVDVCKTVTKRRFSMDGDEVILSEDARAVSGAGCDVEIAAVTVREIEAWTFAFAAFGPAPSRQDAIIASWQALLAEPSCPPQFGALFGQSSSYPAWLARAGLAE
jgi:hypothetical protein